MNRVSVLPEARKNIDEHAIYIAQDNPDAAYRFIDAAVQSKCFPILPVFHKWKAYGSLKIHFTKAYVKLLFPDFESI